MYIQFLFWSLSSYTIESKQLDKRLLQKGSVVAILVVAVTSDWYCAIVAIEYKCATGRVKEKKESTRGQAAEDKWEEDIQLNSAILTIVHFMLKFHDWFHWFFSTVKWTCWNSNKRSISTIQIISSFRYIMFVSTHKLAQAFDRFGVGDSDSFPQF